MRLDFQGICAFVTGAKLDAPGTEGVKVLLPDVVEAIREHVPNGKVAPHAETLEFERADLKSPVDPRQALARLKPKVSGKEIKLSLRNQIVELEPLPKEKTVAFRDLHLLADLDIALVKTANGLNTPRTAGRFHQSFLSENPAKPVVSRIALRGGLLSCRPMADRSELKPSSFAPRNDDGSHAAAMAGHCYTEKFAMIVHFDAPVDQVRIRPFGSHPDDGMVLEFEPGSRVVIRNDCDGTRKDCKDQDPDHFLAYYELLETKPRKEHRPLPFFGRDCAGRHDEKIRTEHTSTEGSGCIPAAGRGGGGN